MRTVRSLGLAPGDFVLLEQTDRGTYELVPASLVPRDQLWFHHPEMQARVARAEAEFAAGGAARSEGIESARELLDGLKARRRRRR